MSYELAKQLLDRADELVSSQEEPELLLEVLGHAEEQAEEDVSILCRSARLLYRYALLHSKGRFFILALDKLKQVEHTNPLFLDTRYHWWQLWGNILVQLGKVLSDAAFFEMALNKYQRAAVVAERLMDDIDSELYWDWGEAWALLAKKSGELNDYREALSKFHQVQLTGTSSLFFRLDYGNALVDYALFRGHLDLMEEAISTFRSVIADSYYPDEPPTFAYLVAWRRLACALKLRFSLSHSKQHFDEADKTFRQAILAHAKNSELWLDWGELFLRAGWLKRDLKLIELGLEKLTALKVRECDPLRVSCLLGIGLLFLGLFHESLRLIHEGKQRIEDALKVDPENRQLSVSTGFSALALALYFSDDRDFARAVSVFEQGISEDAQSVENWHALFQTCMAWGLQTEDPTCLRKAIAAISRLCSMRPFSATHWNEWGVSLLRLKELEEDTGGQLALIEEAIEKFRRSVELGEDEENLYNWGCALDLLGEITGEEGDYLEAIDLLSKAFEKKPNQHHIRYHLAMAFSHLGELTCNPDYLTQAVDFLESIITLDSEDESIWCDLGYTQLNLAEITLASLYPERGMALRCEAEKSLVRAAQLGSSDAYYHLACLYSLSGLYKLSIDYLVRAAEADCLPPKSDLEEDEWLSGVRSLPEFQEILTIEDENG